MRNEKLARKVSRIALCGALSSMVWISTEALADETAAEADQDTMVQDVIVVSAQRRDTTILEVPVSVTAVGGGELEQVSAVNIQDYAAKIPGLNIVGGGTPGQATLTLRGVSSNVGGGANVATYIDDTPVGSSSIYSRANALQLDLFPYDLERLEVVRGPQGTLYGASAMGGLLKYVTKKPSLDETTFRVEAGVRTVSGGDDPGYSIQGAVSTPLVRDKLGVSLSGYQSTTPGYIDNYRTGRENINEVQQSGARLALQWAPNADLSVNLSAILQEVDADDQATVFLDPTTSEPVAGDLGTGAYLSEPFESTMSLTALNVGWNLGVAEFVSSTSYSDVETRDGGDGTSVYGGLIPVFTGGAVPEGNIFYDNTVGIEKFTQELRLVSSEGEGLIGWIIGAFYTDETAYQSQYFTAWDTSGSPLASLNPMADILLDSTYTEYAVYGDVTLNLTERLEVTGGVRWSRNEQDYIQSQDGLFYGFVASSVPGSSSEDVVTYMLSPKYSVSDDVMVYARFATGYRPGGPNATLPGVPPQVDSDTLDSYEVGLKARLFGGNMTLETAAFQNDWDGLQVTTSSGGFAWLENGGNARVKGAELASSLVLSPEFTLGFNASYTDTKFLRDEPSFGAMAGDRIPFVPEWLLGGSLDYRYDLAAGWSGWVSGTARYVGDQAYYVTDTGDSRTMDSYAFAGLSAGLNKGPWELKVYANNLTDSHAHTRESLLVSFSGDPVNGEAAVLQPRTVGVSVGYSF